jgi:hypothetical protein
MTHATYIWVFKILKMDIFIECWHGSKTGMGGSTLHSMYVKVYTI